MSRLVILFAILLPLCASVSAQEKKRFVLYAMLTEDTPVQLADGSKWKMDKGDTFPVVMFKEQQTKAILQIASTSFLISTSRLQVVEEKDVTEAQLQTYRANVNNYIEAQAAKLKEGLK